MPLENFERALDDFEAVLAAVPPGRWDAPSPCDGWSAADVAGHVIGALQATEALAAGRFEDPRLGQPRSVAGDDPLAAWQASRARTMAALGPAALTRPVPLPWGGFLPLGEFLDRYPVEILVHTWDLAQATGQDVVLDADLVRGALETAREFAPVGRDAGLIGPERPVGADASDLDRLLGLFGRSAG